MSSPNTAKTNIIIDANQAIPTLQKLEQGFKKTDTAQQSAARSGTQYGNSMTQTEQKINAQTRAIQKMDASFTLSAKSTLGLQRNLDRTGQSFDKNVSSANALGNSYRKLEGQTKGVAGGMDMAKMKTDSLAMTTEQAGSKMSKMGGFMKNNLTNASLLAGGIAGLDDQFHRLTKSQVGYERAQLMQQKTSQKVVKLEQSLHEMRSKGLQGTADYTIKLKDLSIAKEQEGLMSERAEIAQTTLNEATEDFYIGILPNLIFVGGSAMSMIQSMGLNMDKLKRAGGGLKGAIFGLAGAFTGLGGAAGKLNLAGMATSFLTIGAPILAAVAAVWLLVGAYRGITNVSKSLIEANDLQISNLNALQIAYLNIQNTMSNIGWAPKLTAQEKKDMDFYNNMTPADLDKYKKQAEQAGKDINKEFLKGFTTLPAEVKSILDESIAGLMPTVSAGGYEMGEEAGTEFGTGFNDALTSMKLGEAITTIFKTGSTSKFDVGKASQLFSDAFIKQAHDMGVPMEKQSKGIAQYIKYLEERGVENEIVRATEERLLAVYGKVNQALKVGTEFLANYDDALVQKGINERSDAEVKRENLDLYNQMLDKQNKHGVLITKEGKVLKDGVDITKDYNREQLIKNNLLDESRNLYISTNEGLIGQAKGLGMNEEHLKTYTANTQQSKQQLLALNINLATNILDLTRQKIQFELGANAIVNYTQAQTRGTQAAGEFLMQLKYQTAETEAWVYQMDEVIPGVTKLAELYGLTNEQIKGLLSSMVDGTEDWKRFNDGFNKFKQSWENAEGLKRVLKIESDVDGDIKDMIKDMEGKKYEGKLKMRLKLQQEQADAKAAIHEYAKGYITVLEGSDDFVWSPALKLKNGKFNEKEIDEFGKSVRDKLDDAIEGKKGTKGADSERFEKLRDDIDDAIDQGGTKGMDKLLEIINNNKDIFGGVEPIPVSIDDTTLEKLFDIVQAALNKDSYPIVPEVQDPIFPGGGFDMGEDPSVDVTAKINKVDKPTCTDCDILSMPAQVTTVTPPATVPSLDTSANITRIGFIPAPGFGLGDINNLKNWLLNEGGLQETWDAATGEAHANAVRKLRGDVPEDGEGGGTMPTIPIDVDIAPATKNITRLMGNYMGYVSLVNEENPAGQINISPATKSITRLIGNFMGYVKKVNTSNPIVKIDITKATKAITRLIGNLEGIPNITRTVTIKHNDVYGEGGIVSYGGSFARGGIIESAASGKIFTTQGKHMIMIGDNPGGREMLAAIPYNDPFPTLEKINQQFASLSHPTDGGMMGEQDVRSRHGYRFISNDNDNGKSLDQYITFKIDGNDIVNTIRLDKRVRSNIGTNRDRFL